jgi:uncharacterized membrane protein YecN with MAPEG domain
MTLTITGIYAAVLGVLFVVLRTNVIIERAKTGISILHQDNVVLAEKIRRFGNFTEVVPLALILLAVSENSGVPIYMLHAIGGALLISRILHPFGLDAQNGKNPLRILSGILTSLAFVIAIGSFGFYQFAM